MAVAGAKRIVKLGRRARSHRPGHGLGGRRQRWVGGDDTICPGDGWFRRKKRGFAGDDGVCSGARCEEAQTQAPWMWKVLPAGGRLCRFDL
jgi:hypothetical protein